MAERREMGRDAADPRMHDRGMRNETTTGRGETTGRQPGHIERHESRSSAGNEAQVAGILHGSGSETGKDSGSSGRIRGRASDESDATSHQNANAQRGSKEQTHGQPEKKQSASERSSGKKRRGAA